jgi:RNA polymerase sigma-70 factor, ECF subfamily
MSSPPITTPAEPPLLERSSPARHAISERDRDARAAEFTRLYHEQVDRIYGLCLRMSGDSRRAEELVQDVFIRVWRNFQMLTPQMDPGAWVWRLSVNVALNGLRSDRRLRAKEELFADVGAHLPLEPPSTPVPIRRMALEGAVRRLPAKARKVYLLHDVEGHSHKEIAELLGIAEGTVRAQLHRARKLMREVLKS